MNKEDALVFMGYHANDTPSWQAIRKQYKKMALQFHPDKLTQRHASEEELRRAHEFILSLNEALSVLENYAENSENLKEKKTSLYQPERQQLITVIAMSLDSAQLKIPDGYELNDMDLTVLNHLSKQLKELQNNQALDQQSCHYCFKNPSDSAYVEKYSLQKHIEKKILSHKLVVPEHMDRWREELPIEELQLFHSSLSDLSKHGFLNQEMLDHCFKNSTEIGMIASTYSSLSNLIKMLSLDVPKIDTFKTIDTVEDIIWKIKSLSKREKPTQAQVNELVRGYELIHKLEEDDEDPEGSKAYAEKTFQSVITKLKFHGLKIPKENKFSITEVTKIESALNNLVTCSCLKQEIVDIFFANPARAIQYLEQAKKFKSFKEAYNAQMDMEVKNNPPTPGLK